MDVITYFLAHARLAPVQCATWGHSMTSGISTMDYYITMINEVPDAAAHYTEQLVRFKTTSVFFLPPRKTNLEAQITRESFGFPAAARIYVCPQSLHKMHPRFDAMIRGILEKDPQGAAPAPNSAPEPNPQPRTPTKQGWWS